MTKLRFSGKLQIEDIRKHSEETMAKLRRLLTDGATAQADPRRKDFYEVENGRVVYYIHPADRWQSLLAGDLAERRLVDSHREPVEIQTHKSRG